MSTFTQKHLIIFLIALILAMILNLLQNSRPLEQQLIELNAEQNLPYLNLSNESAETQAILVDYSDNQALVLTAWLALKQYPKITEKIISFYGEEPEFKQALLHYGVGIIPIINYFLSNEISSLTIQETLSELWKNLQTSNSNPITIAQLSPQQRGWYAVNYLNQEGYNFLGQFALDKNGTAQWIQSDRMLKTLANLLTSGIRELEINYKTNKTITSNDILWASVDVFTLSSSFKLLKASKAISQSTKVVHTEKSLSLSQKLTLFSSKLVKGKTIQFLAKYTTMGAATYIAFTHPSIINSLLEELANNLGINLIIFKVAIVSMLLFLVLEFFALIFSPLLWLMRKIISHVVF